MMFKDQIRANITMRAVIFARFEEELQSILTGTKSSHSDRSNTTYSSSSSTISHLDLHNTPSYKSYLDSLSTGHESLYHHHALATESIDGVRSIAKRMSLEGYLGQCIHLYANARKSLMERSFCQLGIEKISVGDVRELDWDTVNAKFMVLEWIKAAEICVHVLFVKEKQLCEQIFQDFGSAYVDACFLQVVNDHAVILFSFAEAVSVDRRSPKKLFMVLHLYTALSYLLPDFNNVFESNFFLSIRNQAAEAVSQLAEAARGIVLKFENDVLHDQLKAPVPRGDVHSLTKYVMCCMNRMIRLHKKTLTQLIISKPSMLIPDMEAMELDQQTPLAHHLICIIAHLQLNLVVKSKHYVDESLDHLFMMNNIHYIVQEISGFAELKEMIGNYFLEKLTEKVQEAKNNYLESTWDGVLYPLESEALNVNEGLYLCFRGATLEDSLERFYAMFGSVHQTQAKWLVPNLQLREELHLSILKRLIPTYVLFLFRLRGLHRKHSNKYIRYEVEDLDNAISDFFKGHLVSKQLSRPLSKWSCKAFKKHVCE
ncbi:exocyst complex component EXO70B1-like [Cornus florida]|uniref:exocyst complex component EXO70B1-like n=1 Tax=Cornus florida TaxID=4283 RepID=UPI00289B7BB8|nr:exocyst complex component EXO70B1-like [Cornus florida]